MKSKNNIITHPISNQEIARLENIEALFFAYRDFISDPDMILNQIGFGRAHHRVLYFVNRRPGLSVAELLDILKITKQSLARVLRELIDKGHIIQEAGAEDRRRRLLYPTPSGRELILKLSAPQSNRIEKALKDITKSEEKTILEFLGRMID